MSTHQLPNEKARIRYLEGEGCEFPNNTPRAAIEAATDCARFSDSYISDIMWHLVVRNVLRRSKSASHK